MVDGVGTIVGGAVVSAFFSVLFDRIATQPFLELFKRQGLDDTFVERLKTIMMTAHAMLSDAEEMQFTNPFVKRWIDELKGVIYDVEDLVEEINYIGLAETQSGGGNHQRGNRTSTESFESRFEKVILRFEDIVKHKDVFWLNGSFRAKTYPRIPSTFSVDELKTHGRKNDKVAIMDFLLDGSKNEEEIPVIAITGMAGIGKTTLAQLLYNDSSVVACFAIRVWVYVSEQFDVLKVCKTILESITSQDCNITDLSVIQRRLRETLDSCESDFLLVLDDVWNENFNNWDALKKVLTKILRADKIKRSRIIVTTRSQGVASTMHAFFIHPLRCLNYDNCKLIFDAHASDKYCKHPDLKEIGEKIIDKCQGLPLAAKILGNLLYSKVEASEWKTILDSNIWDLPGDKCDILPSLALSYCHLPHDLKQCFSYCSMFPKGHVFEMEQMVLLWKAEGFLPSRSSKTLEEVGCEFFEELLSKSFFQLVSRDGKSCFMMHDFVNELAQFVSGEYCCRKFKTGKAHDISMRVRRFSYHKDCFDNDSDGFKALFEAKCLRTFLPFSFSTFASDYGISGEVVKHLLEESRQLRVLFLFNYKIEQLPYDFSKLILLKYLDFSYNPFKTLPSSIGDLYYLETLILSYCNELTELPANMRNLINLGYLDLTGTWSLRMMPLEFGKLEKLFILTNFVVGSCTAGAKIDELGKLLLIRDKLSISQLQNVTNAIDAENANLKGKKDLKELVLSWSKNVYHDENKDTIVFEKLQPHGDINKLSIEGYHGTKFPDWMGDSSFKMKFLYLSDCKNCSLMPSLGQLSSLQELYVEGIESLQCIDSEFYGKDSSSVTPFKSLCILKFVNMPNWHFWAYSSVTNGQFPSLRELHLQNCRNFIGMLPDNLGLLEKLYIEGCPNLQFVVNDTTGYPNLQNLDIRSSCETLVKLKLDSFKKLMSLTIKDCKNLQTFEVPDVADWKLEFIERLEISDCNNLKIISKDGLPAPNLRVFLVSNCNSLQSMPKHMHNLLPSLQRLIISYCPQVQSISEDVLPAKLKSLLIEGGFNDLKAFPMEGLLPTSLTILQLGELSKLEILNLEGFQLLNSLETLTINNCVSLSSMSEDGELPKSLSSLTITGCSLLTDRCQPGGEDWPKISHIPNKQTGTNAPLSGNTSQPIIFFSEFDSDSTAAVNGRQ